MYLDAVLMRCVLHVTSRVFHARIVAQRQWGTNLAPQSDEGKVKFKQ